MKFTFRPEWKWSYDIKPIVGTDSLQEKYISVIVERTITCRYNEGSQITYSAGDAFAIELGYDARVFGSS